MFVLQVFIHRLNGVEILNFFINLPSRVRSNAMVKEKTILTTIHLVERYSKLGWTDTVHEALVCLTSMMFTNPSATEQFQQGKT